MGNYYGINFSDGSHIEHGIRDAWANHKYKARKWVNGAWQYIYDDYKSAKRQHNVLKRAEANMLEAQSHNVQGSISSSVSGNPSYLPSNRINNHNTQVSKKQSKTQIRTNLAISEYNRLLNAYRNDKKGMFFKRVDNFLYKFGIHIL